MNPLVSIIIPTYNRANKIFNCLDSIVSQSYSTIEIVVVDDGSTDNTQEKIEAYIKEKSLNDKLLFYRQENQGAPTARNNGLEKSNGSLIVFFDSDDFMFQDRILKQVIALNKEDSDCCACGFVYSVDGKEHIPKLNKNKGFMGSFINWELVGSTICWMYKREILYKTGGYDVSYACYQDWDITFRYLTHCRKISIVKEVLNFVDNGDNVDRITSQLQSEKRTPHIQRFYLTVLKWLTEEGKNTKLLDNVVFTYVQQITLAYYRQGKMDKAKNSYKMFVQALELSSFHVALFCKLMFVKHLLKTNLSKLLAVRKLKKILQTSF